MLTISNGEKLTFAAGLYVKKNLPERFACMCVFV